MHYTFVPQVEMTDEAAHLRAGDVSTFAELSEYSTLTGSSAENYLIESDNLPALLGYIASGAAKADVVYIDPPYNRMKDDLTYADSKRGESASTGGDPHAPWASFMLPRLVLAREALRETGVIIVHIGRDENARLSMLMDRVFGPENKVSNITWHGGSRKAKAQFVSQESDYMHVYAKNLDALSAVKPEAREHADDAYDGAIDDLKQAAGTKELLAMLGRRPNGRGWFDYPKPTELLSWVIPELVPAARIAESASDPVRVLDFFGGSGSTGHAVLDLDAREGEEWRFTLVTINEGGDVDPSAGIARAATSKRLRAAVTGEWVTPTKRTRSYDANVRHIIAGFTEPTHADGVFPWGAIDRDAYVAEYRRLYALIVEQGGFVHDLRPVAEADGQEQVSEAVQLVARSTAAAEARRLIDGAEARATRATLANDKAKEALEVAQAAADKAPSVEAAAALADAAQAVADTTAKLTRALKAQLSATDKAMALLEGAPRG